MKKRISALLLSMMMILSTAACVGGTGKSDDEVKNFAKAETPFRFAAYMPPPPANVGYDKLKGNPDYMTLEHYQNMADAGFDYTYALYESSIEDTLKALDLAEQVGLKYIANDSSADSLNMIAAGRAGDELTEIPIEYQTSIKSRLDRYKDHPAFAGSMVYDEPPASVYQNLGVLKKFYNQYLPGKEFYVNLYPYGAANWQYSGAQGVEMTFDEYLDSFVEKVSPEFISYDQYPLVKDTQGNPALHLAYLYSLEAVANKAKEIDVPFYVFLLTMGHWNYRTPNNYADIAWQVYNAMAYGAKGAQTFTYWTTMSAGENITYGLVDWYGNKTQVWYSMQEVISEIRQMQDAYLNFEWQNTMAYTADFDYPNEGFSTLKNSILIDETTKEYYQGVTGFESDKDALVGCFKDKDGREAYMLTNLSDPGYSESAKVKIEFGKAKEVLVYKKGRSVRYLLKNGVYETTIGSGEGQFVIPLK